MTQTVTLRRWNRRNIALLDALKVTFSALGSGATLVAMCSTPRAWRFARLQAEAPYFSWGGLPELSVGDIFDLRAFAIGVPSPFELRWRAEGMGSLAAWLTTRDGFDPMALGADALASIAVAEEIESHRLLFGRAVPGVAPEGWLALREGRIGEIRVPYDGAAQALELRGAELVAAEAASGNAHIVEELLTRITAATMEDNR